MPNINLKHRLYEQVGIVAKALGHETRLELVELLAQAPRTVERLAEMLRVDVRSASAHLKVLARAGLVRSEREGRFQRYRLTSPKVAQLAVTLRETAELALRPLHDLVAETGDRHDEMDLAQATALAEAGRIRLVDVRDPEEFAAGHLPHAVNLPLERLETDPPEIPEGAVLVAYCRGPYCFKAKRAAEILARRGVQLRILSAGVMEWQSRGEAPLRSD